MEQVVRPSNFTVTKPTIQIILELVEYSNSADQSVGLIWKNPDSQPLGKPEFHVSVVLPSMAVEYDIEVFGGYDLWLLARSW